MIILFVELEVGIAFLTLALSSADRDVAGAMVMDDRGGKRVEAQKNEDVKSARGRCGFEPTEVTTTPHERCHRAIIS